MIGESVLSDPLTVIAAAVPAKVSPAPYKHEASIDSITIRWSEPSDSGSPITSYVVEWDEGRGNEQYYQLGSTTY
jgi:Fibronectin type III domain